MSQEDKEFVPIYILSRGRAKPSIQHTIVQMLECAPRWSSAIRLVVPLAEKDEYVACMEELGLSSLSVICPPDDVDHIGPTRQWLCERGHDFVFMFDDDMKFFRRTYPGTADHELRGVEGDEIDEMLDRMLQWGFAGFVQVSLAARFVIPGYVERDAQTYLVGARANNVHLICCPMLKQLGIRWDAIEVMEDCYVSCALMKQGYPNIVETEFCWNQRGSGKEGGCSTYRDIHMQRRSAEKMCELFPEFTRFEERQSSSAWEGMGTRPEAKIYWTRMLEACCHRSDSIPFWKARP